MQIHERIKLARESAKLTTQKLADKIGIPRSTYQHWEKVTPSIDNIRLVENALDLLPGALMGDDWAQKKTPNKEALAFIDIYAIVKVTLSLIAEQEAARTGQMIGSVVSKIERFVAEEREAKLKEIDAQAGKPLS